MFLSLLGQQLTGWSFSSLSSMYWEGTVLPIRWGLLGAGAEVLLPVSSGPEVLGWYKGVGEDWDWSLLGWPQWELVPSQGYCVPGGP